ncbi:hypothetical protein E2562_028814 [Oryza meyeriana var. granulata]|uniref:Uncharacterized protein n=1 Tax=Oryza meyeriana var. granulata TaxID=110450 RepID=A0A6G1FDB9_9ORYZ|nr:hypothetical protein E2562_028814 [Oryza meyeriana var. granulata]
MTALSGALGVSLRVENTLDGTSKDLLSATLQSAIQASNTNTGSIEDSYHIAYDTPSVTLVRIDYHFDILYPLPPGATTTGYHLLRPPRQRRGGGGSPQHPGPAAEASSGGAGQREGDPAEGSGRRAARASWFHCCIRGGSKKK